MDAKHYLLSLVLLAVLGLILMHPYAIDELDPDDYPMLNEPPMQMRHFQSTKFSTGSLEEVPSSVSVHPVHEPRP